VTVVRRPLQSMVCSGRLTICDLKFLVSSATYRIRGTSDTGCQIGPTLSHGDAIDDIDGRRRAYLIEGSSAAEAIKHLLTMAVHDTRPNLKSPAWPYVVAKLAISAPSRTLILDAQAPQYEVSEGSRASPYEFGTLARPAEEASKIPNWPPFT
jgi:hypothetical protein